MHIGKQRTGFIAFLANIVLFILKIVAAVLSGSLTVFSSALDSLNDIISYGIGYVMIREGSRAPDTDHPFGHTRMEPLAAVVMAVFTAILSFEIIKTSVIGMIEGDGIVTITEFTFAVLLFTVIVKSIMYTVLKTKAKESPAIEAMSIDSRNDVLSNSIAIIGIVGVFLGYGLLDDIVALVIGARIAYSGYEMASHNFGYLTGAKPDKNIMKKIRAKAMIKGVKIGSVRAHYIGQSVHVEIEIILNRNLKGIESHEIGEKVQRSVESLKPVGRAFIHIDYE